MAHCRLEGGLLGPPKCISGPPLCSPRDPSQILSEELWHLLSPLACQTSEKGNFLVFLLPQFY